MTRQLDLPPRMALVHPTTRGYLRRLWLYWSRVGREGRSWFPQDPSCGNPGILGDPVGGSLGLKRRCMVDLANSACVGLFLKGPVLPLSVCAERAERFGASVLFSGYTFFDLERV
jgi:hypothetical protein